MSGKLPLRKIAPRSGSGFGVGLSLELGLGGYFPRGQFSGHCYKQKLIYVNNVTFNESVTKLSTTLKKCLFPSLKTTSYLKFVNPCRSHRGQQKNTLQSSCKSFNYV